MRNYLKLTNLFCIFVLASSLFAQSNNHHTAFLDTSGIYQPFWEPALISPRVQAIITIYGKNKNVLKGFDLKVAASYLGPEIPNLPETNLQELPSRYSNAVRFSRHTGQNNDKRAGLIHWVYNDQIEDFESNDNFWTKNGNNIKLKDALRAYGPLQTIGNDVELRNFIILSTAVLKPYEAVDLGTFNFVADDPGFYRVNVDVFKKNNIFQATADTLLYVYFECPDYKPSLSILGEDVIRLGEPVYKHINIPIVNGIFFEDEGKEQVVVAENRTDSLFHALLLGRTITAFACEKQPTKLNLFAFPDTLFQKDYKVNKAKSLELSKSRADFLGKYIIDLTNKYLKNNKLSACYEQFVEKHPSPTSQQRINYEIKAVSSGELFTQVIKNKDSNNEGDKYREENRVVLLTVADTTKEKKLFEPIRIQQDEEPDYITLRVSIPNADEKMSRCLESGEVIIYGEAPREDTLRIDLKNYDLDSLQVSFKVSSDAILDSLRTRGVPGDMIQKLAGLKNRQFKGTDEFTKELQKEFRNKLTIPFKALILKYCVMKQARVKTLVLNEEKQRKFLSTPGQYYAQMILTSRCDRTIVRSDLIPFVVKPRAILLDEIFALSPYDSASFTYKYDSLRIPLLIDSSFFKTIDSLATKMGGNATIKMQFFITGHTDVLSEFQVGPIYNLGLSFMRAENTKMKFLNELRTQANKNRFKITSDDPAIVYMTEPMKNNMKSEQYTNDAMMQFYRRLVKRATSQKSPVLEEYYSEMKKEKERHFRTDETGITQSLIQRPQWSHVQTRLNDEAIDKNIIRAMTTVKLYRKKDNTTVIVDLVSAGFGAAIPFYRKFELVGELKELLIAGGLPENVSLEEIYANDNYPSGRVMNRRIEVNLIWDKTGIQGRSGTNDD